MPSVYLCANIGGRQVAASGLAVERLSESLSSLYFPNAVTPSRLQEVSSAFGSWTINTTAPGRQLKSHISVAEYLEMLRREEISPVFKDVLANISRSSKDSAQQDALRHFDISRFCEFRVALNALTLPHVSRVGVVAPNSRFDQMKADVLVFEEGEESGRPLQVKATEGQAKRLSSAVPTVKGAWRLKASELVAHLKGVFSAWDSHV